MSLACVSSTERPLGSISFDTRYGCCKHLQGCQLSRVSSNGTTHFLSCISILFIFDLLTAALTRAPAEPATRLRRRPKF